MDIVQQGKKHPNYVNALSALAKMKYQGAYKYIVERAKKQDAYKNGSVGMLKEYGNPESIPLLLEMREKIPPDMDKFAKRLCVSEIDNTINYLNTLKESQEG